MSMSRLTGAVLLLASTATPLALLADDAEPATKAANAAVLEELDFSNTQDFENARRGFISTI
ncbi:MAG: hypothetical protein OIF40_15965, partial [Mangrovicoccus sp.]|nr:hypothetical protein [Mangrovicoccus sp.]